MVSRGGLGRGNSAQVQLEHLLVPLFWEQILAPSPAASSVILQPRWGLVGGGVGGRHPAQPPGGGIQLRPYQAAWIWLQATDRLPGPDFSATLTSKPGLQGSQGLTQEHSRSWPLGGPQGGVYKDFLPSPTTLPVHCPTPPRCRMPAHVPPTSSLQGLMARRFLLTAAST